MEPLGRTILGRTNRFFHDNWLAMLQPWIAAKPMMDLALLMIGY